MPNKDVSRIMEQRKAPVPVPTDIAKSQPVNTGPGLSLAQQQFLNRGNAAIRSGQSAFRRA